MKKLFKKKWFRITAIIAILVVIGIVSTLIVLRPSQAQQYVLSKAEKKDLLQTVSEIGAVKAAEEVELSFPSGGKLKNSFVKIGDRAAEGQLLAELDYQSLSIQRDEALSNLNAARASLAKILIGATPAEIAVVDAQAKQADKTYQAAVDSLAKTKKTVAEDTRQAEKTLSDLLTSGITNQTTYEQAIESALTTLNNAKATYQKSIDNAVSTELIDANAKLSVANTALDNIDQIVSDADLKDYLSAKDKSYLANTKTTYDAAQTLLASANISLAAAQADKTETKIKQAADDAITALNKTVESLNYCFGALENSTFNETTLTAHKTTISTQLTYANTALSVLTADKQTLDGAYLSYQTNVSAAAASYNQAKVAMENAILAARNALATIKVTGEQKISAAENSVNTAKESSEVAKRQLAQLKSPARTEDITLADSKVKQAEAAVSLISKQIEDSLLKAPMNGKIVREEYKVGEQVMALKPVFAMLAENDFEIEVDISESDIAKIKEGDKADITLDAFGEDEKFSGLVSFIEPAETIIQEVIYYKVKIKFTDAKEKLSAVRPGMTANVTIVTDLREGVVAVPERAVIEKNGGKIVRILRAGALIESPVKTGLRGDEGLIEIRSGVGEGDEVVVFIKTNKK